MAIGVGGAGVASAATPAPAALAPAALAPAALAPPTPAAGATYYYPGCVLQTVNGHYVTAVGGGGRTTDVIHTDATRIGSREKFTFVTTAVGAVYGIETANGHYLTAVDGGGRTTDVIHSDATWVGAWEKFTLTCGH